MAEESTRMDFNTLVSAIRQVHEHLAARAGKAVNISLTLRNWVIGLYIREYEQNGSDRAEYGENLLNDLARRLHNEGMKRTAARELRRFRQFYTTYPQIRETVSTEFHNMLPDTLLRLPTAIRDSMTPESEGTSSAANQGTVSPRLHIPPELLISSLSFSHFAELIQIDDQLKRIFYEVECIQGNWSVRELKRQIGSLYFERSGLSLNKKKLAEITHAGAEQTPNALVVRDPYIFEFLGIKSKEVMSESDLEDALLDKLQDFLLELGHGFCFEARQKRILIGDTYGFVDLVFYHRILKCHVLIDLKVEKFTHENIGQLNTYVSWYRKNTMTENDSSPIGILLCAKKDHALVEYALAGMDNNLFVSKYQLELPSKEDMQRFLEENIQEIGED
jgi:predicted nuclease of restriction endonuclease-like (RecB) superfamily